MRGFLNFTDIVIAIICGHNIAIDYYERAILGEELYGCRCEHNANGKTVSACPKPKSCTKDTPFGPDAPK